MQLLTTSWQVYDAKEVRQGQNVSAWVNIKEGEIIQIQQLFLNYYISNERQTKFCISKII